MARSGAPGKFDCVGPAGRSPAANPQRVADLTLPKAAERVSAGRAYGK
jgi:hypothetical protein